MNTHDFRNMHPSNKPAVVKQPSFLEYVGAVAIYCAMAYGIMYFALVQATGGF